MRLVLAAMALGAPARGLCTSAAPPALRRLGALARAGGPAARHQPVRAGLLDGETGNGEDEVYLTDLESQLRAASSRAGAPNDGMRIMRGLPASPTGRSARRRRPLPEGERRYTRESTQLRSLPATLRGAYVDFLERPGQPLVLGSLSILVGFYMAGALSTIFGAAGFWEPTIALGPLVVGEQITRAYYARPACDRSQTLKLLNACKVGFYFGVVLDALKLAG